MGALSAQEELLATTNSPHNDDVVVQVGSPTPSVGVANATPRTTAASTALPPKRKSFRVVGQIILAMKRFQAALNPTISFGKQSSPEPDSEPEVTGPPRLGEKRMSSLGSSARRDGAGPGKAPRQSMYSHRGHKTDLLFGSLTRGNSKKAIATT